ncbi:MAG: phosphonoacetaldehyde hydrolase [Comamonadaceae bacterium]|nr:MAG: phosphonoacetaldehyde hydrolase [Comamonadaceae bacterium]
MKPLQIQAVIFDWAGTVIDFGSQAPMGAFVELFKRHGLSITIAEARVPMGMPKWHHIQALGQQPRIAALWEQVHGRPFDDSDVDALYEEFTPMNAASVVHHATLIAGALDTVAWLRARGVRIGSTTGYNRAIMEVVMPLAATQGFTPENVVCADDLPESRPSPMGMRYTMERLGVNEPRQVVKVDDTVPGLLEGRRAGCWTVAVLASGNALGLTEAEWEATSDSSRAALRAQARESLSGGQPDYCIDTVADLPGVIEAIEARGASAFTDR